MSEKRFYEVSGAAQIYGWASGVMAAAATPAVGITAETANRAYIQLDIPALPRNPRIAKAELTLTQSGGAVAAAVAPKFGIYHVTDALTEGEVTPVYDEKLMDFALMQTGETTYALDITALTDKLLSGETDNAALAVKLVDESLSGENYITLSGAAVTVTYETSYGVNTSYRTHSHDLGRFGQGSVDLLCGNLMFESEAFAWGGSRMPVAVKHLYNSALCDRQYTANADAQLHTGDFSAMRLGCGWKLNVMQSMVAASFTHEGAAYDGYIYIGENGDEVCFKPDGDSFVDVQTGDMIYDAASRTLTQGEDSYGFDEAGRLVSITDAHGNRMDIVYDQGRIVCINDGTERSFSFTYGADDQLTSITAPDGSNIEYQYTEDMLTDITYADGRKVALSYVNQKPAAVVLQDAGGSPVYKVEYTFTNDRVASVTEYGVEDGAYIQGIRNNYSYSTAARRTFITSSRIKDGSQDRDWITRTVYAFDHDGNVVSDYIYTQDAGNIDAEISGSGIHPYAGDGGASVVHVSDNQLLDHGFTLKLGTSWTRLTSNAESFETQVTYDNKSSLYGRSKLSMISPDSTYVQNGIEQTVYDPPAGQNTLSAYVRVISAINGDKNPGVYLRVVDCEGVVLGESEHLCCQNNEYLRLEVPFTVSSSSNIPFVKVQILMNGTGSVYADAAQLENNPCANAYNLLENGNFLSVGHKWTLSEGVKSTTADCFSKDVSMAITGDLEQQRNAMQQIIVKNAQAERETFTLSGWAKGYALPAYERSGAEMPTFRLRAVLRYADGNEETFTGDFCPCTEEWQYASIQFCKSQFKSVSYVKVYCDYDYNFGTAYFDDVQLIRDSWETGLTAADFVIESTEEAEEITEETVEETAAEFEELLDAFGNTLTETTFFDGEFGTVYRSFGYDENGNDLIRETDARGNVTTYTVDPHTSRNTAVTDRCGNTTAYAYDVNGRTSAVTTDNAQVSYSYDAFDNLSAITRGDGMQYDLGYNAFHNLESIGVSGKEERLVSYTYKNGNGRLKRVDYANGDYMTLTYNSLGQVTAEKWYDAADTLTAHYKYLCDGQGNITRSIDILNSCEYSYTYEDGRLIRVTQSSVTLSGENVTGKVLTASMLYSYDAEGQLTKKYIVFADGAERVITSENPEDGNPVVKFIAADRTITSHSKTDSFGRKVFDELQLETGFVSRQFAYYAGQIPEEHQGSGKVKSAATTQLVSQIILSDGRTLSYEYDAEERITKVTDSVEGVTEYTYDAQGQLLTETVNGEVVNEMVYDGYGNITSKNGTAYTYGDSVWKDKLTAFGDQTITYDAQGNPTNYLGHTLTWEKGRQLKSFDGNQYAYNANGIRTGKTVNGVVHTYTLDGTNILRETWADNTLVPLYDNEESVCGIEYNTTPYFFLKNLQGDVIAITNIDGDTVARYSYDAWGVCTILEDTSPCSIAGINPYRYRSYYFDPEIGMYYLQSRYYDPAVGRFVNADDVMFTMSISGDVLASNLCNYCCNDAINFYDPVGMSKIHNFLTKANRWFLSHGINTAAFAALVLNMRKDRYGVYHAKFNCWQQYFGYNDLYDLVFNIGTSMRNKKFPFVSGGKSYILWAWKGDYINLGAGAELGIYYGGGPHWKVDKKLAMNMSMTLKYKGRKIISYSAKTWWITGFHPKYLNVSASNLTVSFTVKFNTQRMYQDFAARYKKAWSCNGRTRSASYTF